MTSEVLDRIEADALKQCELPLARAVVVTPGEALELCRLARIGVAFEVQAHGPRQLHVDDGA
jgi:hypothetical protein